MSWGKRADNRITGRLVHLPHSLVSVLVVICLDRGLRGREAVEESELKRKGGRGGGKGGKGRRVEWM